MELSSMAASSSTSDRSSSTSTSAADRSTLPVFSTVSVYVTESPGRTGSPAYDVFTTVHASTSEIVTQSSSKSGSAGSVMAGSGQSPPVTAFSNWPSPSESAGSTSTEYVIVTTYRKSVAQGNNRACALD